VLKTIPYFSSPSIPFIIDCNKDKTILKNKAVQKESIAKPRTMFAHNSIIIALITNKNNPKVRIVTGKVKIIIMGLINILSNPRTIATINAVVNPATRTPGIKFAISNTKPEVIRILISKFMKFCF
jgi:hypothetical protein